MRAASKWAATLAQRAPATGFHKPGDIASPGKPSGRADDGNGWVTPSDLSTGPITNFIVYKIEV
jgi:hypothetical protein